VYQDEYISAFFDYFPASKWHILIVPNEHYENLHKTPDEILWKIISLSKKIANFYKDEMWIENINIHQSNGKLAWQEVFHYHMHLIPRYASDKVHFKWEADESLRSEYDELKEFISKTLHQVI
jgi:histidine triad (HIT) family protein